MSIKNVKKQWEYLCKNKEKSLRVLLIVFVIFGGSSLFHLAFPDVSLAFNRSQSLNGWVYIIIKNRVPNVGELVAFYPPKNPYYQNKWFVKEIKAQGGDRISFENSNVYINGVYESYAKSFTKKGKKLARGNEGTIPVGYYYVGTSHPDSYDSRYADIGWIPQSSFIGRAIKIF